MRPLNHGGCDTTTLRRGGVPGGSSSQYLRVPQWLSGGAARSRKGGVTQEMCGGGRCAGGRARDLRVRGLGRAARAYHILAQDSVPQMVHIQALREPGLALSLLRGRRERPPEARPRMRAHSGLFHRLLIDMSGEAEETYENALQLIATEGDASLRAVVVVDAALFAFHAARNSAEIGPRAAQGRLPPPCGSAPAARRGVWGHDGVRVPIWWWYVARRGRHSSCTLCSPRWVASLSARAKARRLSYTPRLGDRRCKLVHSWVGHLARAPPGHPIAEIMCWRSPLWWCTCQVIGGAIGHWRHGSANWLKGRGPCRPF